MTDTDAQFDPTGHVTEHKDIEWDEEFQPYERRLFRWDLIADQLRQRPGKWARVTGAQGRPLAQKHLDGRGPSCPVPLREGRWQVTTRRGELWLRFLGD